MSEQDRKYYQRKRSRILAGKAKAYRELRAKELLADDETTIVHEALQLIRGGASATELAIHLLQRTTHGHRFSLNLGKITVPMIAELFAQSPTKVLLVRAKCRQILGQDKS